MIGERARLPFLSLVPRARFTGKNGDRGEAETTAVDRHVENTFTNRCTAKYTRDACPFALTRLCRAGLRP